MRGTKICAFLAVVAAALPATAQADSWTATKPLTELLGPSVVLLPNGKVLATGNQYATADAGAELYDPATGIWSAATTLGIGRIALLGDGTVFVAAASPQVYDPITNVVGPARPIAPGVPAVLSPTMRVISLDDGSVMAAGDFKTADPPARWGTTTPTAPASRGRSRATWSTART